MSLQDSIDSITDRIRTLLGGLTPRDRRTLLFGISVVLLVAGWFAFQSMQKSTQQLNRNLAAAEEAQRQVEAMLSHYQSRVGAADALEARLQAHCDIHI